MPSVWEKRSEYYAHAGGGTASLESTHTASGACERDQWDGASPKPRLEAMAVHSSPVPASGAYGAGNMIRGRIGGWLSHLQCGISRVRVIPRNQRRVTNVRHITTTLEAAYYRV